jgi:hypothetical protein
LDELPPVLPVEHSDIVSFSPVHLLFAMVSVEYERVIAPSSTVFVAPVYRSREPFSLRPGFGFGADVGARYFIWGVAPRGFFVSAQVYAGRSLLVSTTGGEPGWATHTLYGAGSMVGFTASPIIPAVLFSLGLGLGCHWSDITEYPTGADPLARKKLERSW